MAGQRGRKPKGNYKQKTEVFSTRITAETKRALERAANENNHSLSQEVEHRLRRSFDKDERIFESVGNRQNYALLRLLASLFESAPNNDVGWLRDPDNFNHIIRSVYLVLTALRPPGAAQEASEGEGWFGAMNAAAAAADVIEADASMPPEQRQNSFNYIRSDLGEELVERLGSLTPENLDPEAPPPLLPRGIRARARKGGAS